MANYNFLNLSPYEFENLTRDLLQKHLECYIESFTNGRDGGIDLRCAKFGNTIIQCKRYDNFNNLKSNCSISGLNTEKIFKAALCWPPCF